MTGEMGREQVTGRYESRDTEEEPMVASVSPENRVRLEQVTCCGVGSQSKRDGQVRHVGAASKRRHASGNLMPCLSGDAAESAEDFDMPLALARPFPWA